MPKKYYNYDIKDAMELFEKFEGRKNNIPFFERLDFFVDAFNILNSCNNEENISPEKALQISRLKHTYMKYLIEKLPSIDTSDPNIWAKTIESIAVDARERENILNKYPELKKFFQNFIGEYI